MNAFKLGLRRGRRTGFHLDMAGLQVHNDEDRVAHRTGQRHHFHLEEVHGSDGAPVGLQERGPWHVLATLGGRFDPVFGEDASYGGSTDLVAQGEHDIAELGVSPAGVLFGQPHHQVSDMLRFR